MSYSAPSTHAVGYLVLAADWNQDVGDNIIALHDAPGARAYHNTTQSASHAAVTALALNSEQHDNGSLHDTVTNNSRLTAPLAGVYLMSGFFAGTWAKGTYLGYIRVNAGVIPISKGQRQSDTTARFTSIPLATFYQLSVNDYIELLVQPFIDAGSGSITIGGASGYDTALSMQWIGAGT